MATRLCLCTHDCVCWQCTRSCGGGIQFRSVTCVGGRACVLDERPADDRPCNTGRCDDVTRAPAEPSDVTAVTATTTTARSPAVVASSAAVPRSTTTTATTATTTTATRATTTASITTTTQAATTTRRPGARYRWMALFWDQVLTDSFTSVDCI